MTNITTPAQAWAALAEGNARFVAGTPDHPNQDVAHRASLTLGQRPPAIFFGCGDSRVAAEMIFDQGLGDLFVVRTAGHVFDDTVLGSLEFGAEVLGAPLLVVLGHDRCGAVQAAMAAESDPEATPPGHIKAVTDILVPGVRKARAAGETDADAIGRAHLSQTVEHLLESSEILRKRVEAGTLALVGAVYTLADGNVKIVSAIGELPQE